MIYYDIMMFRIIWINLAVFRCFQIPCQLQWSSRQENPKKKWNPRPGQRKRSTSQ